MAISRRAFLGLAPASVGAIALGVTFVPSKSHVPALTGDDEVDRMLIAAERAADPPLLYPEIQVGDIIWIGDKEHVVRFVVS